jgi:transcriptional regulator with XRE-family HTH domain
VPFSLSDVASQAGVSRSTVSRVLNGGERVSHETRARVLSVMSKLNYKPDIHAVNLRRGKGRALIKGGIQMPTSDRIGIESNADPGRKAQNEQQERDSLHLLKLHLLKEENIHLKRLIASLNKEVEMWREISSSPHHPAG